MNAGRSRLERGGASKGAMPRSKPSVRVEHADFHTYCSKGKAQCLVDKGRAVWVNDGLIHMGAYPELPENGGEWRIADSSIRTRASINYGPKTPVRQWERVR